MYAVLQINFRGSTGYGKQYVNAGDRQWAGTMHTDFLDGKDWVAKQGIADPAKVCIMGGSYGGYATLAGVTFSPDAFACGVDIVGPSNLNILLKTIPPYWSTLLATLHKRMGDSEAVLKEESPLFKADQIKVPLLIGQGANDPRVSKAESDQIVAAMRKNDKTVQYYVFPDEGHGFARRPTTWPSTLSRKNSWRNTWEEDSSLPRRTKASCWRALNRSGPGVILGAQSLVESGANAPTTRKTCRPPGFEVHR
jgi:dipeptidyl aminopeptidase/acylaminoacyl peptidase